MATTTSALALSPNVESKLSLEAQELLKLVREGVLVLTKTNLLHLKGVNANISPETLQALVTQPSIKSLTINGIVLGNAHTAAIANALKGNNHLTTLILNHNEIGPKGAWDLCESVGDLQSPLKHFDLSHNPLTSEGGKAISRLFGPFPTSKADNRTRALETLILSATQLGDVGISHFIDQFTCIFLDTLDLSHNYISAQSIHRLNNIMSMVICEENRAEFPVFAGSLRKFNLSGNPLGSRDKLSTYAIAEGLGADSYQFRNFGLVLEELNLSNTGLRDDPIDVTHTCCCIPYETERRFGVGHLATAIRNLSIGNNLRSVDLSGNAFSEAGKALFIENLRDKAGSKEVHKLTSVKLDEGFTMAQLSAAQPSIVSANGDQKTRAEASSTSGSVSERAGGQLMLSNQGIRSATATTTPSVQLTQTVAAAGKKEGNRI